MFKCCQYICTINSCKSFYKYSEVASLCTQFGFGPCLIAKNSFYIILSRQKVCMLQWGVENEFSANFTGLTNVLQPLNACNPV